MLSPSTWHDCLDLSTALPFHLLAVSEDVAAEEIDILAEQIWAGCSRVGEGLLHLCDDAYLTGPWQLTPEAIVGLGLPLYLKYAYLISVPALRGAPVPDWMLGRDPMWDAFREGGPEGLELDVLQGMRRMARRLAGALRFSTGPIVVPDPDSAVSLRVLSKVWLDPAACLQVVQSVQPEAVLVVNDGVGDSIKPGREVRLTTAQQRAEYDPDGLRSRLGLSSDERAWLHAEAEAFDEAAMSLPPMVDAFAISVDVSNISAVHVIVQGETVAPVALGNGEDGFVSYEVQWVTPDVAMTEANRPRRAHRLDRLNVIDTIESIARALAGATQGVIFDQDDFVVAF